ncbi:pectinesterase family protein [Telmatobacter bradus]|uniref:pectinesterase family protein n=1 Tax=Telmatobacter bradus TaxID=474953 RepID=UPI003B429492
MSIFLVGLTGLLCHAQTPVALPYTMTTLAGGLVPTTYTAGTTLCPGSTTVKATTTYGDGCAAVAGSFAAAGRGGVVVDQYNNVFVADDTSTNRVVHRIDQNTGIMSVVAGAGTVCSTSAGKIDSAGDGCLAASQTVLAGPRGIGLDAYGNVLIPEYSQNLIHIVCRYASPLCTTGTPTATSANPIQVKIGYMGIVAGCSSGTATTGAAGLGYDGYPGFSTATSAVSAFNNSGACSSYYGDVEAPRAAWGDIYGNIYYADTSSSRTRVILGPLTSSYFSGNNPLYAALEVNTNWTSSNLLPSYVYTIVNVSGISTSTTTAAAASSTSACPTSITSPSGNGAVAYKYSGSDTGTDTHYDGCPFFDSAVTASSGYTNTTQTDAAGNLVFTDPGSPGFLRVFFVQGWSSTANATTAGATGSVASAGVAMYNAIVKNNSGKTPTPGYIYALAGGGSTTISTTPTLGASASITDTTITKIAISPQGNIYIGDSTKVLFYDIYNGTIRTLLTSGSSPSSVGTVCNGSTGAVSTSIYGDGCPASALGSYAKFGNTSGLGVAVDAQGNLYMYDGSSGYSSGMLVRKVLAQGMGVQPSATLAALATVTAAYPLQSMGTTQNQTLMAHFPVSTTSDSASLTHTTNSAASFATPACTYYAVDGSADCTVAATYTPTAAGPQSSILTLADAGGEVLTMNLANSAAGSVLAVDGATSAGTSILNTTSQMSGYTPTAIAVDGAGYIYEIAGSSIVEQPAGSSSIYTLATPSNTPTQLAVDAAGNIYYLNGTSTIQALRLTKAGTPSIYTSTAINYVPANFGTANPEAIAVDQAGNLLVADGQGSTIASTIYRISPSAYTANAYTSGTATTCNYASASSTTPSLCQETVSAVGAFASVDAMTVDPGGNIYVADSSNTVYKLTPSVDGASGDTTYKQYVYVQTTAHSGAAKALATDAAGNLYVQNASTSAGVVEYPLSGPTTAGVTVLGAVGTPAGIGVDGSGNLYSADTSTTAVTEVQRNAIVENFASSTTTEFAATLTNVGNQASSTQTATYSTGSDAADFTLAGGSSYGCSFSNELLESVSAGQACSMTAYFPALGISQETDYIAFGPTTPATATSGLLTLTGLGDTEAYATGITIGTASPTSPIYASSGIEASFPIAVTASTISTDGMITTNTTGPTISNYITVSIDSGTATQYYLTSASGLTATLTLNLSGLTAGNHSFTVNFPLQGEFTASTASSGSFTVARESTSLTWSPSANSQQVSAPIGTGVLNATISPSISGYTVYSSTASPSCTGTSGGTIDASTYLPINSYTLYAIFCPNDSTDYASTTASISYSVVQASTTASVGASTSVVAADGTGNYTSLSSALVALPVTGGSIYIKPGTYTGQNAISYPNVALRGLGGDATKVILTAEDGAFSSPFTGYLGTGTGTGNANASGDQGSSTLDVTKSYYMGETAGSTSSPIGLTNSTQYTPNNFFAEYLTIQNTYDMDATTKSTYYYSSSTCNSGGTATSLQALYNAGTLCNSQALALWIESDQAVLNNVNLYSQQDTLYAGSQGCGTYCTAARQYIWKGLISGNVDYVFGDAALVFDHTYFFTTWHGTSATGTETIEAQNKKQETGSSYDYLSGYVCNGCTLMSESTGMSALYYGRPYGAYSTWIQLNNYVDQVAPVGWIEFSGDTNLPTSTYGEYNSMAYTDPALSTTANPTVYPASINGITPAGGNTGSGVTSISSREMTSTNPGTLQVNNSIPTQLTAAEAVQYYPINFLSSTVSSATLSSGSSSSWNPVSALTSWVNNFAPTASLGALTPGTVVTILGRPQTPGAGVIPTGTYAFYDSLNSNTVCSTAGGNCTLLQSGSLDASGEAYLTTSALASGTHSITMVYGGDTNFAGSTSSTYSIYVLGTGQVASSTTLSVANTSSTTGTAITGTVTVSPSAAPGNVLLYLDGVNTTSCTLASGSCSWSLSGPAAGTHTLYAYYGGNTSYGYSTSSSATLVVETPIATGDTRTVTEPSFPAVCKQLTAGLTTDASTQDLDTSVDATTTNPDGARIQAALNACSGTGEAVELSMDSTRAYNAFLSGPLSMPTNVTLLVDPGVTLYFSRNVQDYDKVSGTHTCGTINNNTATNSCLNLIDIPKTSTNVGIMGYGKLNGRGGDTLLNAFTTSGFGMPSSPTWWSISSTANGEGSQQNPRFIQMESGTSNITLYKISLLNAPMFHVTTGGAVSNFTAWDIKIVTPTAARNTDGIDPGAVQNATIAYSWISDGDDNIAVAGHNGIGQNMSIIHNHFYAGHGESIGSLTDSNVTNILFDHNTLAGNAFTGYGSAQWGLTNDTNSTGLRIKTSSDRGGTVSSIQYSNSCFLDHKADIQFTPYYNSTDGTEYPNFNNILLQNLVFMNDDSGSGTVELDGYYNSNGDVSGGSAVTHPLGITMDNVTFPSTLSSLVASTSPSEGTSSWNYGGYSGGTGQYVGLTIGPGEVSSNFLTLYNALAATATNYDTLTNNLVQSSLDAPTCTFTYLAPELASPNGNNQTISYGNTATLYVLMTPTVGGAPYPTGTVTLTDETTNSTYTGTFTGTSDTLAFTIPVANLGVGTHTFEATGYTGDSNYTVPTAYQTFGSQAVTVNQAAQSITFAPATTSYTYASGLSFGVSATSTSGLAVSFASLTSSACTVGSSTLSNGTSSATVSILTGGTCTIETTQTGNSSYQAATPVDVNFTISTTTQTITFAPSTTAYSYASGLTYSINASSSVGLTVSFATKTSSVCAVSNSTGTEPTKNIAILPTSATVTVLTAGSCTIEASQSGSANYSAATPVDVSFTIQQGTPSIGLTLSSGSSPSTVDESLTFTATVTSTVGSPSGTVTFLDGTTTLSSVSLTSGAAAYTTTALAAGSHSITAVYSGNTNFTTITSSTLSQSVVTVVISTGSSSSSDSGSGNSQTVAAGDTATYSVSILPSAGSSFPTALTLTLSGLPTGATVSITPSAWTQSSSTTWTLAAGTTLSGNTLVNIKLPNTSTAKSEPKSTLFGRGGAAALAFLILLPFASRMRRTGKRLRNMVLSLLLLGALAAGITACGAGTGYYSSPTQSYTVVLTVASGSYSQSTNLMLNVE